jgi:hypothetical protein
MSEDRNVITDRYGNLTSQIGGGEVKIVVTNCKFATPGEVLRKLPDGEMLSIYAYSDI